LRDALDRYARERLTLADFEPSIAVDAELPIADISNEILAMLRQMEPFGMGNPEPVFSSRAVKLMLPPRILKEKHIKLRVGGSVVHGNGNLRSGSKSIDALGWRMAERFVEAPLLAGDTLDIAFRVEENSHPDFGGLQLNLADLVRTSPDRVAVQAVGVP
jgi:single-stranded-DNA-specific exonuclease